MKKKITYKQWQEIGLYNYAAEWLQPFCSYFLVKEGERFKIEQCIPLWFYLIIFIPAHLVQALSCMWDGGLREFEFAKRYLGGDDLNNWTSAWEKAKEVWEK